MNFHKNIKLRFDRSFSGKWWKQVIFLGICVIIAIIFTFTILCIFYPIDISILKTLSYFFDSNAFHSDAGDYITHNHVHPLISMVITFTGMVLMSGMLISFITNRLERHVENIKDGHRYYPFNGHIIILGYDDMVAYLVKQICKENKVGEIVLQTVMQAEEVREQLHTQLSAKEEKRITIIHSKRDSVEELENIYVHQAKEVYLLGEMNEFDHDIQNINCLSLIAGIRKKYNCQAKLTCITFLCFQSTFALFQTADISEKIKKHITFVPFNFSEVWARKVLVNCKTGHNGIEYKPLDYEPIGIESTKTVHLVIVGMTSMGIALAIEAAHIAHYPNYLNDKSKKTRITFIDLSAKQEMDYIINRYPNLFSVCKYTYRNFRPHVNDACYSNDLSEENDFIDLKWEFIQGDIADPNVRKELKSWCEESDSLVTIAVCFNNPTKNIATGLYLPKEVYEHKIPVLIQQNTSGEIFEMLDSSKYKNIRPFGMCKDGYDIAAYNYEWAKKINYVYDYCSTNNHIPTEFPVNEMEKKWAGLSVVKQWSNIYCASSIPTKLRSIGINYPEIPQDRVLSAEEIEMLAETEHNRWNVEELLLGYRPATEEEKNIIRENIEINKKRYRERFIHLDIQPFNSLEEESKYYDRSIAKNLLNIIQE